jgi:DNA-binding transcriptional LysR family regulator
MLELRHLRYFLAVAEERSFSHAAERLHMAQPPLSVAIRQLEQEVGAELFERGSRGVTLTPAGRALLEGARDTLDGLDRALAAARRAAAGELGTLRVGFSWSARFATLPALGQAFAARYPDVTVVTEEMWNARMPRALRSAAVDVAIALCPEIDRELAYEPLRREPAVALVSQARAVAGAGRVALRDLAEEEFLLFPRDLAPRLYDTMIEMCRQAGFEPRVGNRAFHAAGDTGLLSVSPGVALAPASVAGEIPGVAALALIDAPAAFDTYLVWHSRSVPPVAVRFREVAQELFPPQFEHVGLAALADDDPRLQASV